MLVVRDEQHRGAAAGQSAQTGHQPPQMAPVLPDGRLVQDEQGREGGQDRGQGGALLFTDAQGGGGSPSQLPQPGGGQRELPAARDIQPEVLRSERDLLLHSVKQELAGGVLKQQARPPAGGQAPPRPAPTDLAGLRPLRTGQHPSQRAIAAAVGAHQGGELPRVQIEVKLVEDSPPSVGDGDPLQPHQLRRHGTLLLPGCRGRERLPGGAGRPR